ncbi:hypothetical protein [Micromonospora sp. NPDC048063]|uniref:hypothetical protein n=1 Tax=Micromonospora sp. NPDC048063 TaxID=3364256 RepID=UPI003711B768
MTIVAGHPHTSRPTDWAVARPLAHALPTPGAAELGLPALTRPVRLQQAQNQEADHADPLWLGAPFDNLDGEKR